MIEFRIMYDPSTKQEFEPLQQDVQWEWMELRLPALSRFHKEAFTLLTNYLVCESFLGCIVNDSFQLARLYSVELHEKIIVTRKEVKGFERGSHVLFQGTIPESANRD
jgi:hypothetical protein